MRSLFERSAINGLLLGNRFVRAATWEGLADEGGGVTPKLAGMMAALAEGGVGLIITSHCFVSPDGKASRAQTGMHDDSLVEGHRRMTGGVHAAGGKIAAQLSHAGNFADEGLTGKPPLVASAFEGLGGPRREMTPSDIGATTDAFSRAAGRAVAAGYDAIQIHAAHGFLLSQFLSPAYNLRRDDYGGPLKNRARFLLEVCRAVRDAVGKNFPVLVKINCRDFVDNGLTLEDSIEAAALLAEAGIDSIEISGGMLTGGKLSPVRPWIDSIEKEAYFREEARAFRKRLTLPLILLGGIRSFEVASSLVGEGTADYISMSRPFLCEPGLINRWRSGDLRKALCTSDQKCILGGRQGETVYCHNVTP